VIRSDQLGARLGKMVRHAEKIELNRASVPAPSLRAPARDNKVAVTRNRWVSKVMENAMNKLIAPAAATLLIATAISADRSSASLFGRPARVKHFTTGKRPSDEASGPEARQPESNPSSPLQ